MSLPWQHRPGRGLRQLPTVRVGGGVGAMDVDAGAAGGAQQLGSAGVGGGVGWAVH